MHLTIAHLAEQPGEPLEFVVDTCDRRPVQQLAEHPQGAAQPADRDPRVVDRVDAAAKSEIAVEDVIDLLRQVARNGPARGGRPLFGPGVRDTRASLDGYRPGLAPALFSSFVSRRGTERAPGPSSTSISRHASSRWSIDARTWSSASSAHSSMTSGFGDPIAVAHGADRRHVDQRFTQPQAGQQIGQFRRRRIGQRCADLDPSFGVRHLQLPAGVVVAVAPPQQHTVGLQVAVGGVVVRAVERRRCCVPRRPGDDVVEAGEREVLVDVPFSSRSSTSSMAEDSRNGGRRNISRVRLEALRRALDHSTDVVTSSRSGPARSRRGARRRRSTPVREPAHW